MDKPFTKTYAFIGILSHEGLINKFLNFIHLPAANLLFTPGAFLLVASYIYIPFMILPIFNSMKAILIICYKLQVIWELVLLQLLEK